MNTPFELPHYDWDQLSIQALTSAEAACSAARLATQDPWLRLGYSLEGLQRYLTRPDPALHRFAIAANQTSAGVICVRFPWLLGPYLELVAIWPEQQGQGIGERLLAWLAAEARPARNLWATVSAFNTKARQFYARQGFHEAGCLPGLVRPEFDEILLRKVLGI
jgi:GNAT superfamily N-acetyltransferase